MTKKHQTQTGASKLGNAMNLMDRGAIDRGLYTSIRTGLKFGISPLPVSCKGIPFRSMVLLRQSPSFGVKWYSSLNIIPSDALIPTLETALVRPCLKDLILSWVFSFICKSPFLTFEKSTWKMVWLLKLIRSSVIPACNNSSCKQYFSFGFTITVTVRKGCNSTG